MATAGIAAIAAPQMVRLGEDEVRAVIIEVFRTKLFTRRLFGALRRDWLRVRRRVWHGCFVFGFSVPIPGS